MRGPRNMDAQIIAAYNQNLAVAKKQQDDFSAVSGNSIKQAIADFLSAATAT